MAHVAALLTSDCTLVRCALDVVRPHVRLTHEGLVSGLGAFEDGVCLVRRFGLGVLDDGLWAPPASDVVLLTASALQVGASLDDGQPFRQRGWLVAVVGDTSVTPVELEQLLQALPEHLRPGLALSLGSVVAARFVAQLHAHRAELAPSRTQLSMALVGAVASLPKARLGLVVTDGQRLGAVGPGLSYRLYEGQAACARCEIEATSDVSVPLVRDHRRRRTVAIASDPLGSGWRALESQEPFVVEPGALF